MTISVFDLFSIGVGPSSSHTVGPMKAAYAFAQLLDQRQLLESTQQVIVDLYGSLALTGVGHGTHVAILSGLEGHLPEAVDPDSLLPRLQQIQTENTLHLFGKKYIDFDYAKQLLFHRQELLPCHTNGMRFTAYAQDGTELAHEVYYSIGGGFIVTAQEYGREIHPAELAHPFKTATDLWQCCRDNHLSICDVMMANEKSWRTEPDIRTGLLRIADVMQACIARGIKTHGILPGGLKVKRRAADLAEKLAAAGMPKRAERPDALLWPTVYAMAVNEENAAGGRIVTAPTNGAAGIIPAVLTYYRNFHSGASDDGVINFLLTAAAIGILYKSNASISGAEVGCQGEVGVACSMAAGALTAVLGGTLEQIENAAEMAMEHHLGMTCDPVQGLVQIPCIERNGVAAEKAIKLTYLALLEDGKDSKVSLDKVIATMFQTGKDMMSIYKETSQGGLAANIAEC